MTNEEQIMLQSIKKLFSEIDKLKSDLALKREELQTMYMEHKGLTKKIETLQKENNCLRNKVNQLKEDYQTMYEHP